MVSLTGSRLIKLSELRLSSGLPVGNSSVKKNATRSPGTHRDV